MKNTYAFGTALISLVGTRAVPRRMLKFWQSGTVHAETVTYDERVCL